MVELLQVLVARDALTHDAYFDRLLRLRRGDARFLPFLSAEIVYWLSTATIESDGEVQETTALATLRRYGERVVEEAQLLQSEAADGVEPGLGHSTTLTADAKSFQTQMRAAGAQAVLELERAVIPADHRAAKIRWIVHAFGL
jgi:hypothetical protein